jgi:hypothetical protein
VNGKSEIQEAPDRVRTDMAALGHCIYVIQGYDCLDQARLAFGPIKFSRLFISLLPRGRVWPWPTKESIEC